MGRDRRANAVDHKSIDYCILLILCVNAIHCVSKNDTNVAHYSFDAHQPILVFFAEMLPREYAMKWWFVIPPLLTNVPALPAETWTLEIVSFQSYRVSKTTLLSEHAVECRLCLLLVQTCVHCIASTLVNLQNNRVYAPSNVKKRDIAPERLLRCRPTFSWSLTVSVAVSKLGCTKLFFVEPGVKVYGRYNREVLLKKQTLPVMCRIASIKHVCV